MRGTRSRRLTREAQRRPAATLGASVFSYVGAEAPADPTAYQFQGNTGKTRVDVAFPPTLAPGTGGSAAGSPTP